MFRRLRTLFARATGSESEIAQDEHQVTGKPTGGVPGDTTGDDISTTGTSPNDNFVGRVAGDDDGYAEETGAEKRAK